MVSGKGQQVDDDGAEEEVDPRMYVAWSQVFSRIELIKVEISQLEALCTELLELTGRQYRMDVTGP